MNQPMFRRGQTLKCKWVDIQEVFITQVFEDVDRKGQYYYKLESNNMRSNQILDEKTVSNMVIQPSQRIPVM